MPVVTLQGVHKAFGQHVVLGSVTLTVRTAEHVGVVGVNGAGKSTLARLLAGLEQPDGGEVQVRRGARIQYLEQIPRFDGDPTAEDAVLTGIAAWRAATERHEALSARVASGDGDAERSLGELAEAAEAVERLGGWDQRHRALTLLTNLGMTRRDARISTLSGGEQRRVALARLLVGKPDLAVLDEPTNHLDADTIEWLEKHLIEEYPGAVVLITHDRYLLDRVATRTLEVAHGEVHDYDGGYERYLEQKAERLAHAARAEQNRQNFLRRELEWLRRQPKARTTKQAARVRRAEAAVEAPRPRLDKTASFELDVARSGKTILELHELSAAIGGRRLFSGLDLFLTEGDRIGIVGPNGAGKSTLLRIITGALEPASGRVVTGSNTRVVYLDQARSDLDEEKTVFENVMGDQSVVELGGEIVEPRAYLERFAFDAHKQRQPVSSLSGGERARVALARMLRGSANLVILDEPTNDLDVATLSALEGLLVESAISALVVSHDRWFLDRVATDILAFEPDGRVVRYPGNYATFRRLRAEAQALERPDPAEAPKAAPAAAPPPKPREKKGLSFAEKKELDALPDRIDAVETRVAELNRRLGDPATYAAGASEAPKLTAELDQRKAEAEALIARWEELETRK